MNQTVFENILIIFFRHQLKLKMYHFQSQYYGGHKASDAYLEKFESNLDKFMEVAQGIVGKLKTEKIKLTLYTLTDETIVYEIDSFIKILRLFDKIMLLNTELLNIRDEMIGEATQLKYLLSFK